METRIAGHKFSLFEDYLTYVAATSHSLLIPPDPEDVFRFLGYKPEYEDAVDEDAPSDFLLSGYIFPELRQLQTVSDLHRRQPQRRMIHQAHELGHLLSGQVRHRDRSSFPNRADYLAYVNEVEYPATLFALSYMMPALLFEHECHTSDLPEVCGTFGLHPWDVLLRLFDVTQMLALAIYFKRDRVIPELIIQQYHGSLTLLHNEPELAVDSVLPRTVAYETGIDTTVAPAM